MNEARYHVGQAYLHLHTLSADAEPDMQVRLIAVMARLDEIDATLSSLIEGRPN